MQRETVWLVEDEQGIADTLVYMLQQEGFAVEVFERGLPVLDKARQQVPDVMYSAAIFLIPICISFDTAEKRRYATYLILNRRFSFEF
ncbi:hypothetical protein AWD00_000724 [Escherichia coli]|nr:hypothetical protein [Escherichia coli]